jgi:hypothetical protein
MPKVSDAFPSKYLAADVDVKDMDEGGTILTIRAGDFELVGQGDDQEQKLVLYFEEVNKGLIVNKTNATTLSQILKSDDTDDWIGKAVKLYAKDVEFSGKMVRGIRVNTRLPVAAKAAGKGKAPVPQTVDGPGDNDSDEDVPF